MTNGKQLIANKTNQLPADQNPAACFLGKVSKSSRRTYGNALHKIANIFGSNIADFAWHEMRYQHASFIRQQLIERYAPATVNVYISALRGVMRESWLIGHITEGEYRKASSIDNVKSDKLQSGRYIPNSEIKSLLSQCENDPMGVRDRAIIALMWSTGLRRSEIVNINMDDFDAEKYRLEILGAKGNKDRITYVQDSVKPYLDAWLKLRGNEDGALFTSIRGNDRSNLTPQTVYNIMKKRQKQAGIKSLTPHDFRKTYISNMIDAGVDMVTIADMVGHEDINTTRGYDRRDEKRMEDAATVLILD